MKDVCLSNSIIHMKEVGGSEKIRPYWSHYMNDSDGVIFVLDGTDVGSEKMAELRCV